MVGGRHAGKGGFWQCSAWGTAPREWLAASPCDWQESAERNGAASQLQFAGDITSTQAASDRHRQQAAATAAAAVTHHG